MVVNTRLVLRVFLADPWESLYGSRIGDLAGLPSGTTYPILVRLERLGWLSSFWDDVDPRAAGRPPRRRYALTTWGENRARDAVAAATDPERTQLLLDHGLSHSNRTAPTGNGDPAWLPRWLLGCALRGLRGEAAARYRREITDEMWALPCERRVLFALSILAHASAMRRAVRGADHPAADGLIPGLPTRPLHCRVHLWHAWTTVHQPGVAYVACRDCRCLARRTIFDPVLP
jgi:hypothetical protein